jgi:hypothetical protein
MNARRRAEVAVKNAQFNLDDFAGTTRPALDEKVRKAFGLAPHGLDPGDSTDALEDPDNDGIRNGDEYVFSYAGADPQSPDAFIEID